jgi:hypothetical protein
MASAKLDEKEVPRSCLAGVEVGASSSLATMGHPDGDIPWVADSETPWPIRLNSLVDPGKVTGVPWSSQGRDQGRHQ